MDLGIRSLSKIASVNMSKECEINEIRVKEGVDLCSGIKILYFPMWCNKGDLFHRSMLCKWTTSLAYSNGPFANENQV
jgi:hypothetical protein